MLRPTAYARKRLAVEVFEALRDYVVDNRLRAGELLPSEAQIARELNCGKTSVREALKILEAIGIVEISHGKGTVVKEFSITHLFSSLPHGLLVKKESLREFLEVRQAIEMFYTERIVANMTSEKITQLEQIIHGMREVTDRESEFHQLDQEFHLTFMGSIGNKTAKDLIRLYWRFREEAGRSLGLHSEESHVEIMKLHQPILDAIKKRDLEKVRAAYEKHFEDIDKKLLSS